MREGISSKSKKRFKEEGSHRPVERKKKNDSNEKDHKQLATTDK